jgi:hypothetical protein
MAASAIICTLAMHMGTLPPSKLRGGARAGRRGMRTAVRMPWPVLSRVYSFRCGQVPTTRNQNP